MGMNFAATSTPAETTTEGEDVNADLDQYLQNVSNRIKAYDNRFSLVAYMSKELEKNRVIGGEFNSLVRLLGKVVSEVVDEQKAQRTHFLRSTEEELEVVAEALNHRRD